MQIKRQNRKRQIGTIQIVIMQKCELHLNTAQGDTVFLGRTASNACKSRWDGRIVKGYAYIEHCSEFATQWVLCNVRNLLQILGYANIGQK